MIVYLNELFYMDNVLFIIIYVSQKKRGNKKYPDSINILVNYHYQDECSVINWYFPSMSKIMRLYRSILSLPIGCYKKNNLDVMNILMSKSNVPFKEKFCVRKQILIFIWVIQTLILGEAMTVLQAIVLGRRLLETYLVFNAWWPWNFNSLLS